MTIVANEAFVADYIGTMIDLDFTALTFEIIIANTDAITTLAIQTAIHALARVTARSHAFTVLTDKVALADYALTWVRCRCTFTDLTTSFVRIETILTGEVTLHRLTSGILETVADVATKAVSTGHQNTQRFNGQTLTT